MDDAELLEQWLLRSYQRSARILQFYRADAEQFLDFAQRPLRSLTFADLRAFADYLASTGIRPAVRLRTVERLSSLLWFLRWEPTDRPCPLCNGYGLLQAYSAPARGLRVYVCDECEAAWSSDQPVEASTWAPVATVLERHGLQDSDFAVVR